MRKVLKFVKGGKKTLPDTGVSTLTPSSSGEILSPAQTPEDERFLGLDSATHIGYIIDFCGKDKSLTKLHKAAWQGNLDKLKSALKKVDVDTVDRHNRTALHLAVARGHANVAWHLLGNNAKHTICDGQGCTPLLKAIECGQRECIALLTERGANVNHVDFAGCSGLHFAVKNNSLEITVMLLQKNAKCDVSNNAGEYPLHLAIKSGNADILQALLRAGAKVNVFDRENRTPLMWAAKSGNLILTQLIIENGAQLNVMDSNGWTAEDYALFGEHHEVARNLKALIKSTKPVVSQDAPVNEAVIEPEPDAETDSPETSASAVPPPCLPPRSWEMIQAGMIDETGETKQRRSITTLGSLHSRRESFNGSSSSDMPKYTLSLHRRKDQKNKDIKQRFSFNEEDSLKSLENEIVKQKKRANSESEWDSDLSSLLNSLPRKMADDNSGTLKGVDEVCMQIDESASFPPPPTAFELGVDMAKSISYMKGISIDHPPEEKEEPHLAGGMYLDRVEEKLLVENVSSRRHTRQASMSACKWRSEELPQQSTKPVADRLIDVNRRINEQLECYDQALRELAESPYAKKEQAIISTLTGERKVPPAYNYYSLPASKLKPTTKTQTCHMLVSPVRNTKFLINEPLDNGPPSLPYDVNQKENNETLGMEQKGLAPIPDPSSRNVESPLSDETTTTSDSDRSGRASSKRHMLLAMRDVKHAVQVAHSFKSSFDDQILSPLSKEAFDLSNASPENYFQVELGRQETVIEKRRKSASSESGEEPPTLWLQELPPETDRNVHEEREFSPLGAVYEEIKAQELLKGSSVAALERLQRLASSSSSESDIHSRSNPNKPSIIEEHPKSGDNDNEEDAEEDLGGVSPDVSFSSGPIEPLMGCSETDSSHNDVTPTKQISLKKWLRERLNKENAEKNQLEALAAQLAEKAERLQYELVDAREATRSRDEVIALLQSQLSRMETAYTKSLEESVHCRLQLNSLEQEIRHLKRLCLQNEHHEENMDNEKKLSTSQEDVANKDELLADGGSLERSSETVSIIQSDQMESGAKTKKILVLGNQTTYSAKNAQKIIACDQEISESIAELLRKNKQMEEEVQALKEALKKSDELSLLVNENQRLTEELDRVKSIVYAKKDVEEEGDVPNAIDAGIVELREELERLKREHQRNINVGKGSTKRLQREVGKSDELAWNSLYGIKTSGGSNNGVRGNHKGSEHTTDVAGDSEEIIEVKVRELELELEKMRQHLSTQQQRESKERERSILHLMSGKHYCRAQHTIDDMTYQLKDKYRLQLELDNLKRHIDRDMVQKSDVDVLRFENALLEEQQRKNADKSLLTDKTDDNLQKRAELLAKEQSKALMLKTKFAEWMDQKIDEVPTTVTANLTVKGAQPKLDPQIRATLNAELDRSLQKHLTDFDDNEEGADSSLEFLKQKYFS